ncbi:MAG: ABC transporter substrate-binding protein [Burkholderiaceae bacterium]
MTMIDTTKESSLILDRRQLIGGASAVGLGAAFASMPAMAQGAPKKGGVLRLGMEGGSASDSLDPRTYADSIPIAYSLMFWNCLVEIDSKGNASPELAESWESKPGALEWIFNIRKGITFTSGKTLDADDVIYSINLHRGETKSPAKGLLAAIKDITKLSPNQVQITLSAGNADLPFILSDYHLIVVPNNTTDFSKPDGTGAFTLAEWQPGVRIVAKRKPGNYWKPGRGNFDSVELRYIGDAAVRTQALVTNQVDAINRVNAKTVDLLGKSKAIKIVRSKGAGNRFCFVAHTDTDPYKNRDVMLGLKFGVDREKIIKNVFSGYASVGNDQTVGPMNKYYNKSLKPRAYDPDKAAFHFKKAGMSGPFELQVSEGAYTGATDSAVIYQESLKKAKVNLEVKRVSGDGYWDNVWLKVPFCAVYWGNRPTADLQLSQTFVTGQTWNDTRYSSAKFDKLIVDARVELDEAKRLAMYSECQQMLSDEAGMVCFAIGDALDAGTTKLRGLEAHPRYDLNDQRIAEKGWFA